MIGGVGVFAAAVGGDHEELVFMGAGFNERIEGGGFVAAGDPVER